MEATEAPELRRLRRLLGGERFMVEQEKGLMQLGIGPDHEGGRPVKPIQHESELNSKDAENPIKHAATTRALANLQRDKEKRAESSKGPKNPKGAELPLASFTSPYSDSDSDDNDLQYHIGQETEAGAAFCPIQAVAKYPYKFLMTNKAISEVVARAVFNEGKFWERKWTCFYLQPPPYTFAEPIFFVAVAQVDQLFKEIEQETGVNASYPRGPLGAGFRLTFSSHEPRPRYAGISRSRSEFDSMSSRIGNLSTADDTPPHTDEHEDLSLKPWKIKVENALMAGKNRKSKSKQKAASKTTARRQQWGRQLRRSQRYLGLRAVDPLEAKGSWAALPQQETSNLTQVNVLDSTENVPELDVSKAPQFPCDEDVVIICIDLEANERASGMITEIGVCTLDTRDLKGIPPGAQAENWRSLARYRHFRVSEYRNHVNSEFISGCPDRFEKEFGKSEFILKSEIPKVMALTCKPPFPLDGAERAAVNKLNYDAIEPEPRKLVLLGHNIDSDINYLKKTGFDVVRLSGMSEVLDTCMIYKAMINDTQGTSLGNLLQQVNISGWNLHNAGNDAAYTLQAFLAMAVEQLANPKYRNIEDGRVKCRQEAVRLAAERADDDFEEWLSIGNHQETDDMGRVLGLESKGKNDDVERELVQEKCQCPGCLAEVDT